MSIPHPDQPSGLSAGPISIVDNIARVGGGDRVRYEITVTNPTPAEAPVTVWLTLPPAVATGIEAHEAAVIANGVAWKRQMAGGERRTYVVSGTVDPEADSRDLTVKACMQVGADASCATARGQADTPASVRRISWIAAVIFGLLAVVGAVWLHRRIRPEQLTPANADGRRPDSELPGGAPSA